MNLLLVFYVGNDLHRDIHGASRVGLKTVLFRGGGSKPYKNVKADYEIDSFIELWDAIRFFEDQA